MSQTITNVRASDSTTAPPRRAPGPRGHWLLGHAGSFRGNQLPFYERLHAEFGGVAAFRLAHRRLL